MPDSPIINGIRPSTEEVTDVNGATVTAQHVQRMLLAISPTDGAVVDLPGDSTYGLGVDIKRLGPVDVENLPGPASAVSYGTGAGNQAAVSPADASGRLMGYAVRETTGTDAATVRFRSGTTVSGTPLGAGVSLVANESVREWFGPEGINVPTAVFLERVSGSTEVTVYWAVP